jgi:polyisoprenoid-binding protein YceI
MKTNFKLFLGTAFLAVVFAMSSCSNTPKGDEAEVTNEQKVDSTTGNDISINTETSQIVFIGNGVGKNHPGQFKLTSGNLMVDNGSITGGSFVIDIKSLALSQKEEMFQAKLLPHMLSADFFDAEKFPNAKFEITSVEAFTPTAKDSSVIADANYKVSGNLTLKDVTKNISFPAKIETSNNTYSAIAKFNIDRTLWGLSYGNDKSLKDKFISETVNISLDIKSK